MPCSSLCPSSIQNSGCHSAGSQQMNTWFRGCLTSSTKQSFLRAMPEPALLGMGQVLEGWPVPSPRFSASSGPSPLPCTSQEHCWGYSHEQWQGARISCCRERTMSSLQFIKMLGGRSHNQIYQFMSRWRGCKLRTLEMEGAWENKGQGHTIPG